MADRRPIPEIFSGSHAPWGKPRNGVLEGVSHALKGGSHAPWGKPRIGVLEGVSHALLGEPRSGGGVLEGDPMLEFLSGSHALLAKPRSGVLEGDPMLEFCSGWGALEGDPMLEFLSGSHALLAKPLLAIPHGCFRFHEGDLFPVINMDRSKGCEPDGEISFLNVILFDGGSPLPVPNSYGLRNRSDDPMVLLAENPYVSYLLAIPCEGLYAKRSNQGESPGSGGRAGEERNGGGGDGNQGIGGGVGGGGHSGGSGNGRRGSRGRGHGGGNGGDDDNDGGGQFGYILNGGRGPRPVRMAEILLLLNAEIIGTLEFLDIHGLSARARILRVVAFGFTSVALICLSASIRQRGTNPGLASVLSWIGSVATFLGFISMIAMALLASIIP